MTIKGMFPLGLGLVILTGCTSVATRIPTVQISNKTGLEGIEYSMVASVSGEACRNYYGLWPIPIFWMNGAGEDAATVDALSHAEGADLLIKTIVVENKHSVGIWYSEKCTTVKGKAIKIKLSSEEQPVLAKQTVVPASTIPGSTADKKVYMRDGSVMTGASIGIESGNLQVNSARGMLTIPISDVVKIE